MSVTANELGYSLFAPIPPFRRPRLLIIAGIAVRLAICGFLLWRVERSIAALGRRYHLSSLPTQ
jgi:hypothetical protein